MTDKKIVTLSRFARVGFDGQPGRIDGSFTCSTCTKSVEVILGARQTERTVACPHCGEEHVVKAPPVTPAAG